MEGGMARRGGAGGAAAARKTGGGGRSLRRRMHRGPAWRVSAWVGEGKRDGQPDRPSEDKRPLRPQRNDVTGQTKSGSPGRRAGSDLPGGGDGE